MLVRRSDKRLPLDTHLSASKSAVQSVIFGASNPLMADPTTNDFRKRGGKDEQKQGLKRPQNAKTKTRKSQPAQALRVTREPCEPGGGGALEREGERPRGPQRHRKTHCTCALPSAGVTPRQPREPQHENGRTRAATLGALRAASSQGPIGPSEGCRYASNSPGRCMEASHEPGKAVRGPRAPPGG